MKHLLLIITFLVVLSSCQTKKIHLTSDAKTGEYIGVVQNEVRDFESKEIIYYQINKDSELIKKMPQEINIYEP